MSRFERYSRRDWAWSIFHRCLPSPARMIDLDYIEHCGICKRPILLGEVAQNVGQNYKASSILLNLARASDIPAVIIFYKREIIAKIISDIFGGMQIKEMPELKAFEIEVLWLRLKNEKRALLRIKNIYPRLTDWKELTAEQFWHKVCLIHEKHEKKYHPSSIEERLAQGVL